MIERILPKDVLSLLDEELVFLVEEALVAAPDLVRVRVLP